jgi:hypothetical protein
MTVDVTAALVGLVPRPRGNFRRYRVALPPHSHQHLQVTPDPERATDLQRC